MKILILRLKHYFKKHKWRCVKRSNSANSNNIFVCDKCDLVYEVNYYANGDTDKKYYIDEKKSYIKKCDESWQGDIINKIK